MISSPSPVVTGGAVQRALSGMYTRAEFRDACAPLDAPDWIPAGATHAGQARIDQPRPSPSLRLVPRDLV